MHKPFVLFLFLFNFLFCQDYDNDFSLGLHYFHNKDYYSSKSYFQSCIESENHLFYEEAYYYYYLSSLRQYHPQTEHIFIEFITIFPSSNKRPIANFFMSEFLFEKKKYKEVVRLLSEISIYQLDYLKKEAAFFYLAYSAYAINSYELSKSSFYELMNSDNRSFKESAIFYYSNILLNEGKMLDALSGFRSLKDSEQYSKDIPYFISKILFDLGNYNEIVNYLDSVLNPSLTNYQDAVLIQAKSLYHLEKYDPAVVYFEEYKNLSDTLNKSQLYQMGFSYYQKGLYGFAIDHLNKIILSNHDSITQYAFYFLGDSYRKTNNQIEAMNAFRSASLIQSDSLIQHDAFYYFAKLCYEHDNPLYNPLHYLSEFLELYPNSKYKDEIYTCLANIYLTTQNYDNAISVLEKSNFVDNSIKEQYQKICFYRAVQLFNDGLYKDAIIYFDKSISVGHVSDLMYESFFWRGEAYYKMNEYQEAIESFHKIPMDSSLYFKSLYSKGYCYFEQRDYQKSIISFKNAFQHINDVNILHDIYARVADNYFLLNDFELAANFYQRSLGKDGFQQDYCAYKTTVSYVMMKDYAKAIKSIDYLLKEFPSSNYVDDATFDLANIYIQTKKFNLAINTFLSIIEQFPNSLYFSLSKLKLGLVYYLKGDDGSSISVLEEVLNEFPNSNVSEQALSIIKNIYTEIGQVDKFLEMIKTIDHDYTKSELDSATYSSAELQYMQLNYDNAINALQSYLVYYPSGLFSLQANYFLYKSFEKLGKIEEAMEVLNYIVNEQENQYTIEGLASLARMSFELEKYNSAEQYFYQLINLATTINLKQEAVLGLLESKFTLYKYSELINYIEHKIKDDFFSGEEKIRINYLYAFSLYKNNQNLKSIENFEWISKNSDGNLKAESMYYMALILHNMNNYTDSQKTLFKLIDVLPGYVNWVEKSLLLLAKNYILDQDMFQAQHVLNQLRQTSNNPLIASEIELILNNYPELKMDLVNQ
ncbi:tetratricopeptide repeat protein [Flavobacteriales bacterium]|nr:tetratricopeptide repeat protein [Flavobacteriales bacterium]